MIITNFTSLIESSNGQLIFDPINFKALNGSGKGKIKLGMDTGIPMVTIQIELSAFQIEDFFSSISIKELVRGEMELLVDIKTPIGGEQELRRTIKGNALMKGRHLTITKLDLDNLLEEYMESQQFDLVDLGAIAIMGPIGPALTKAYDFSGVMNAASEGSTEVRQLMSLWNIKDGKASAQDVALATNKNRIVLKGDIDIVAKHFQNLNVVVVDDNGCSLVSQEMNGPFDNPEIAKPSFTSATGPFINFIKKATNIITKKECEVIYNGSVASPNN
jgi:AsmA protein